MDMKERLLEQGIDLACHKMNLCFQTTFLELDPQRYSRVAWCVYPHSADELQGGLVIHAIPTFGADAPWEEWYVLAGKAVHVCLYQYHHPQADHMVDIAVDDKDHPLRVRGKRWYFYQTDI